MKHIVEHPRYESFTILAGDSPTYNKAEKRSLNETNGKAFLFCTLRIIFILTQRNTIHYN